MSVPRGANPMAVGGRSRPKRTLASAWPGTHVLLDARIGVRIEVEQGGPLRIWVGNHAVPLIWPDAEAAAEAFESLARDARRLAKKGE